MVRARWFRSYLGVGSLGMAFTDYGYKPLGRKISIWMLSGYIRSAIRSVAFGLWSVVF